MPTPRLLLPVALLILAPCLAAQIRPRPERDTPTSDAEEKKVIVPFYGNSTCPISGRDVDREKFIQVGNDRVYVCCKKCVPKVEADPHAAHAKAYPPKDVADVRNPRCPVRGGKTKEDVFVVWQGRKVHFCCPGCDTDFLGAAERKMALLENPGVTELGNDACLVMPEERVDGSSFFIYGDKLIDQCCDGCAGDFAEDPEKYLEAHAKAEAAKAKGERKAGHEHDKKADEPGHDHGGHDHGKKDEKPGHGHGGHDHDH